jgi:hypothetical protein
MNPPPQTFTRFATSSTSMNKTLTYVAPESLAGSAMQKVIVVSGTELIYNSDECAICLDPLTAQVVGRIIVCGHLFHHSCIAAAVAQKSRCPFCSVDLDEPQGTMPSGTMTISFNSTLACSGYGLGTIIIQYSIPSGVQKHYHR